MNYKYGVFTSEQSEQIIKKIHDMVFWLLLQKDPQTASEYTHVDFDNYFAFMMKQIDGFSSLLGFPKQFAHLMSVLEAAHLETTRDVFDWKAYRKLILDAQSLVDLLSGGDVSQ